MDVDRRTFLSAALSLSVGGAVTLALACRRDDASEVHADVQLAGQFRSLATIGIVGREALEALPEGTDADRLLELVAPERGTGTLRREIRDQYARGETMDLRGWPIALTEARIYALVALTQDRPKSHGLP